MRGHERVSIILVIVQNGFQVRFEVVRVSLRTDEHSIQSHIDLLEEGVSQVVGKSHHIRLHLIGIVIFLDRQFHFEETLVQVQEIFLGVHLEGHGIDTSSERVDFHVST